MAVSVQTTGRYTGRPMGLLTVVRSLASTFVALLHSRLDLAVTELQEESQRLKGMVLLGVAAFFGAIFGVLCLTFLIVAIFWDSHRFYALGGFVLFYFGLALIAAQTLRKRALSRPKLFGATISELAKDYERLRSS